MAALSRIESEQCVRDFARFLPAAWEHVGFPDKRFVPGRHIEIMCERLQAAAEGRARSLLMLMPPRHTKSAVLLIWQAWVWAGRENLQDRVLAGPAIQFMRMSYDQALVRRDSARCRRLIKSHWYRDLTGGRVEIRDDRGQLDDWELTGGGGLTSVPMRGGVTGKDSHCQIIDDPHSVTNVESAAERELPKTVFREALPSRVNDPKKLVKIVAAQRTHVDDLAAEIMSGNKSGEWQVVCLPAHYDPKHPQAYRADNRKPGEVLWPERFDEAGLREMSKDMSSYARACQLEQSPKRRGAGIFRNAIWRFAETAPADLLLIRYWDKAATEEGSAPDPDYTSGALGGMGRDGVFWLIDVKRGRWSSANVETTIRTYATEIDPPGTQIYIEEEPGSSGKDVTSYYQRHVLRGYPVRGHRPTGSKLTRIDPFIAAAEAGNVMLVRGAWNFAFIDECDSFTGDDSSHDDQVISALGCFSRAALGINAPIVW